MNLKVISAGAGSGKTYRLTQEMVHFLSGQSDYTIRASGIIATTFTKKAAAELQERVRTTLLKKGMITEADDLTNALIGTVHGLGVKLLKRFAYEAGVSPEVSIIADEDQKQFFNQAFATVLTPAVVARMDTLCQRLDIAQDAFSGGDWRDIIRQLADIARTNAFTPQDLTHSRDRSIETYFTFLPAPLPTSGKALNAELQSLLHSTIQQLEAEGDDTKKTKDYTNNLRQYRLLLQQQGALPWRYWMGITSKAPGKKSQGMVQALSELAENVERHPDLHQDLRDYYHQVFDLVQLAIDEYDRYKKSRGLIDYIDMEILVNHLLDHPQVQAVMADELDLLMVDEFQDTSPIQLEIFLKLARFAQVSVWVGDPKQSIYGFRGAEPQLMQAIIDAVGGVKPEDIQTRSWRSREDIVHAVNAVFVKAFPQIPAAQVALDPIRRKAKRPDDPPEVKIDPIEQDLAVQHWHFEYEGKGRYNGKWLSQAIAMQLRDTLAQPPVIVPKDGTAPRVLRPGDVAVLCRSNKQCVEMAEALHRAGLPAAIARKGLVDTPEARLIVASLKYLLNTRDALAVAELMRLAEDFPLERIVLDRMAFLEDEVARPSDWQAHTPYIQALRGLRENMAEQSSVELLDALIESLDLRRMVVRWGNAEQRLSNIDMLTRMARQYEDRCHRLQTGASVGGFLLYLQRAKANDADPQGSGESPDTVNVLTYHRSKGLEWPLVICHSLEQGLRDQVMGMSIESDAAQIDLQHILAQRWIRYWVSPFQDRQKAPLTDRIAASEWQARLTAASMAEEARLLYVGMTRARDYLVLPTSNKKQPEWLNRCFHRDGKILTLDPEHHETPWVWADEIVHKTTIKRAFEGEFEQYRIEGNTPQMLTPRHGSASYDALLIDVYKQKKGAPYTEANRQLVQTLFQQLQPQAQDAVSYGTLTTAPQSDEHTNYRIVKACLMSDRLDLPMAQRLQHVESLLAYLDDMPDNLNANNLLSVSSRFQQWLTDELEAERVWRHYPIKLPYGGRQFKEQIDYIVRSHSGQYILIDSRDVLQHWDKRKLPSDAAWFYLAELAIRQDMGLSANDDAVPRFRYFVHSVLDCALVELHTA